MAAVRARHVCRSCVVKVLLMKWLPDKEDSEDLPFNQMCFTKPMAGRRGSVNKAFIPAPVSPARTLQMRTVAYKTKCADASQGNNSEESDND